MEIVPVQKARLLDGFKRFSMHGNVNPTYRAQILLGNGEIRNTITKDLDRRELGIELLIASIGKLLGFRVPNAFLVVSNRKLDTSVGPELPSGERLLFASEDAKSPPVCAIWQSPLFGAKILEYLATLESVSDLFPFDTWTANVDRHAGNLLLSSDGVWLIDHGRCFGGPTTNSNALLEDHLYPQKITIELAKIMTVSQKKNAAKMCSVFPTRTNGLVIGQLLTGNEIKQILGTADFDFMSRFLEKRAHFVPKLGNKLLGTEVVV